MKIIKEGNEYKLVESVKTTVFTDDKWSGDKLEKLGFKYVKTHTSGDNRFQFEINKLIEIEDMKKIEKYFSGLIYVKPYVWIAFTLQLNLRTPVKLPKVKSKI